MGAHWIDKWAGGRIRKDSNGNNIYVIERKLASQRYTITLDVASEREALAELALFTRDPAGYQTKTEALATATSEIVGMTLDLVSQFLGYLEQKGRSVIYRKNVRYYLGEWADVLGDKDLRAVTLQDLKKALAAWPTAKKHRIIAIKTFCSYLREELAVLSPGEDATLALKVPPARPERAVRDKGYSMEHIERLYKGIPDQAVRDVILIQAKCGMHLTEVARLARGEGKITAIKGHGQIAGTFKFVHKSGRVHLQSVDRQTLAAALRLQERGSAPVDSWIRKTVAAAAKATNMAAINYGELRHSFVAWAQTNGVRVMPAEGGVPLNEVSVAIGHQSVRTTDRHYNVVRVPAMIKIPINLIHAEDPASLLDRQLPNGIAEAGSS